MVSFSFCVICNKKKKKRKTQKITIIIIIVRLHGEILVMKYVSFLFKDYVVCNTGFVIQARSTILILIIVHLSFLFLSFSLSLFCSFIFSFSFFLSNTTCTTTRVTKGDFLFFFFYVPKNYSENNETVMCSSTYNRDSNIPVNTTSSIISRQFNSTNRLSYILYILL